MIRNEGFVNAHICRQQFDYHLLDEDTQRDLIASLKAGVLFQRHLRTAPTDFSTSLDELATRATEEVADQEVSYALRNRRCGVAWHSFIVTCKLYLSGSQGVVPVDPSIGKLQWLPTNNTASTAFTLKPIGNGCYTIPEDSQVPWSFLDDQYLSLRCREKIEDLAVARHQLRLAEREAINGANLELLRDLSELEAVARQLLPFEGSLLAIREEDAPNRTTVRQHLRLASSSRARGRPKKKIAAAEAYRELYPHGRGKDSWATVLSRLEKIRGIVVDLRTLKAGLEASERW